MELKDKVVIVTGAGRGIGRELALEFARQGARVVCCSRTVSQIDETARLLESEGGTGRAIPADITQQESVKSLVKETQAQFGNVDILFNNAGSFASLGGMWEIDPDQWWQDVTVNLRGVMLCCREVLPSMMARGTGVIINMNGGNQIPGGTGYSCSKVAVQRLTELMAREQERENSGVIVFGMGPGFVRTEMTEIQIISDMGRKWLPSSKDAVEAGRDRPPDLCAKTTMKLLRNLCPEMNGKHFGAGMDVAKAIAELKAES